MNDLFQFLSSKLWTRKNCLFFWLREFLLQRQFRNCGKRVENKSLTWNCARCNWVKFRLSGRFNRNLFDVVSWRFVTVDPCFKLSIRPNKCHSSGSWGHKIDIGLKSIVSFGDLDNTKLDIFQRFRNVPWPRSTIFYFNVCPHSAFGVGLAGKGCLLQVKPTITLDLDKTGKYFLVI